MSTLEAGAEIVLWRLAARYLVSKINPGDLITFSVGGVIVGVARYAYALSLSHTEAWKEFGPGLGVKTSDELEQAIGRRKHQVATDTPAIVTCRIVTDFGRLDDASSLVLADLPETDSGGLLCSTATDLGQHIVRLWKAHQLGSTGLSEDASLISPRAHLRSSSYTRPGQRLFHNRTAANYNGCCVVSGETAAPALIAAHIHSFSISGNHDLTNALLLRSDLHALFDEGYWTITSNGRVLFSSRLLKDYPNSHYSFDFGGRWLEALRVAPVRPNWEILDWHRKVVYLQQDGLTG